MGSSTASNSEATINTSTDSASTLVTNVTSNTDTDATNDSLDLGEHSCSGQSEPLLSSLDEPASHSISSLISPRMLKSRASDQESLIESPCTVYYQKRPLKHHHQASSSLSGDDDDDLIEISGLEDNSYPRTAPALGNNQQSRFPFEDRASLNQPPSSLRGFEKTQSKYTFEESPALRRSSGKFVESSSSSSSSPSSVSANTVTIISPCKGGDEDKSKANHHRFTSPTGNSGGLNRVVFRDKLSSKKRINSAPLVTTSTSSTGGPGNAKLMDNTMFPFDREAIDYERIQRECFALDETEEAVRHYPFLDLDTDPDSPVYDKSSSIFQSPSKSPYRRSQCNASNSSVHESNEMTERFRSGHSTNNGSDDIFRQYAILSQQEKNKSHDRDRDRRSPNTKRAKGSTRKSDAFSPKPISKARHSPGNTEQEESFICGTVSPSSSTGGCPSVLKFDQINSKFDKIPPNQKRTSNCFSSNGNIHKSANALSPTVHHYVGDPNYSPTIVRVTPPLPDLRVDYFNSQQKDSDTDEQGNDEGELDELSVEGQQRRGSNMSRTKRKSPDRGGLYGSGKGGGSHHTHSQYQQAMMINSREEGSDDQKQNSGRGGEGGLDECQKHAQLRSINVTPNPMDGPVCTQPPRATIVVQQVIIQ